MSVFKEFISQENLLININKTVKDTAVGISKRASNTYWHTQSRTLQDLLNYNIGGQYYGTRWIGDFYATILGLCSLLTQNKPIKFTPCYNSITTVDAETLTLQRLLQGIQCTDGMHNIVLYHIPKGKTFLKNLLDNPDNPTTMERIPQIEQFLIKTTNQFTRVYKLSNMSENVVIFSELFTTEMLETIIVMMPHLLRINPKDLSDDEDADNSETIAYNDKVVKLRDIFAFLYKITQLRDLTNTVELNDKLTNLINEYATLFNFEKVNMNSFIKNLATIKNQTASTYYTNELQHTTQRINDIEQEITTLYAKQAEMQRILNAYKTINPADVQPLLDIIHESKAIEILSTTDTKLQLRITAPLQYFTEADFTAYEDNPNSEYNQYVNDKIQRRILHKIFVTREYAMLAEGIITIDLQLAGSYYYRNQIEFNAQRGSLDDFKNFPNPHLYHHNCWSAAKTEIMKNLNLDNYDLVVMQMIAAVQTINIAERASFINGLISDFRTPQFQNKITLLDKNKKAHTYKEIYDKETKLDKQKILEEAETTIANAPNKEYTQVELPDDGDWPELANATFTPTDLTNVANVGTIVEGIINDARIVDINRDANNTIITLEYPNGQRETREIPTINTITADNNNILYYTTQGDTNAVHQD